MSTSWSSKHLDYSSHRNKVTARTSVNFVHYKTVYFPVALSSNIIWMVLFYQSLLHINPSLYGILPSNYFKAQEFKVLRMFQITRSFLFQKYPQEKKLIETAFVSFIQFTLACSFQIYHCTCRYVFVSYAENKAAGSIPGSGWKISPTTMYLLLLPKQSQSLLLRFYFSIILKHIVEITKYYGMTCDMTLDCAKTNTTTTGMKPLTTIQQEL